MKTKMFLAAAIVLIAMLFAACEKAYEGPRHAPVKEQADTTETTIRIVAEEEWDGIIEYQHND